MLMAAGGGKCVESQECRRSAWCGCLQHAGVHVYTRLFSGDVEVYGGCRTRPGSGELERVADQSEWLMSLDESWMNTGVNVGRGRTEQLERLREAWGAQRDQRSWRNWELFLT